MIIKSYQAEENENIFSTQFLLFYGENIGLISEFKKKIKFLFLKAEIHNLEQKEIIENKEQFFSNLFNSSLFNEQKIFIINQCNDKILEIIKDVETKISNQKIFLFSNLLDKKSKLRNFFETSKKKGSIACYEDNQITLRKIIQIKLKKYEGINAQVINFLIENCNADRSKLNNELDKIISYFQNKRIKLDELANLLNLRENDKFNELKDKAIAGKKEEFNKLLNNNYLQDEQNSLYVALLNQRFLKLKEIIKISKEVSLSEAIQKVKPPIFWKDKPVILEQLNKWNLDKINQALQMIYDLELNIKSKISINKNILIKKIMVDICDLANVA